MYFTDVRCDSDLSACSTTLKWKYQPLANVVKFVVKRAGVESPDQFVVIGDTTDPVNVEFEYVDSHALDGEIGHYYQVDAVNSDGTVAESTAKQPSRIPIPATGFLYGNFSPNDLSEIERDFTLKGADGKAVGVRMWIKTNEEPECNPAGCHRSRAVNFFCENYGTPKKPDMKLWAKDIGTCDADTCSGSMFRRVVVFLKSSEKTFCAT